MCRATYLSRLAILLLLGASAPAQAQSTLATGDGLEPLPTDTRPVRYRITATPDLAAGRFDAHMDLDFEVTTPTRKVIVNALELEIQSAKLAAGSGATIAWDHARQRAIFEFPEPLAKGLHTLYVTYSGRINDNVRGVFGVNYPKPDGSSGRMIFTHLCCIGAARRFAPLWDQPDLKAVFELTLIVPEDLDAFSNMPIEKRERIVGGRTRVHFAATPKMSTYLLFFALGHFDRLTRRVGDTEVGVVVQRGKGGQGAFALDAHAQALEAYEDYFGVPYALPKLDAVGMPGAGGFGAMENWGAIFYFEPFIAVDPAISTERDRQIVYEIVAHEVAHQWFGNLVTMRWWDDLWLNEGFASWMASRTSDRFHPEWKMWLHAADNRERGMRFDASATTHPIVREVHSLEEAELAFDDITYEKGAQVIRMTEAWIGEEAFRAAIRAHMRLRAYGNASTADLLRELETASALPVAPIVRDFTEQAGVPLIEVLSTKCGMDGAVTTLTVRQGRFGLDESSRRRREWHVPLTAAVVGSDRVVRQVVRGAKPVEITVPGCGAVKVNVGEAGYYRTLYDSDSWKALSHSYSKLAVADQLGLLKDSRGLAEGGYQSIDTYLRLADDLPADADPLLLFDYVNAVLELDRLHGGLPAREAFRRFVGARFAPLLAQIGWVPSQEDRPNTAVLRNSLIGLLANVADAPTLAEALRRLRDADKNPASIPGDVRKAIVGAVGAGADAARYEDLVGRAKRSTDSAEQRLYLLALAEANDPAIARKVMELSLGNSVPEQLFDPLFQVVAQRHPRLAFDFAAEHYDVIERKMHPYGPMYMAALASHGMDGEFLDRSTDFAKNRIGGDARESFERARATIRHRMELRRRVIPQVHAWLEATEK